MCRRSSAILTLAGAMVLLFAPAAPGDEVSAYLQRLGLRQLLAVHLEEQLESARGEQHDLIVKELADLYAELLESVDDADERERLERRGRALVGSLPDQDAGALRLALLRGGYRTAERIAERHRMRQDDPGEVEQAIAILSEIIPKLNQLQGHLDANIEQLERQLSRSSGFEASSLFTQVEQARALRDECTFHVAWALYYQSWLNDRRDNALVAIRQFSELLDLDSFNPDPNDVSVDLRAMEPIARSILGIALCKSLTSSSATAMNWVGLLDNENTFKPLREEATIWRIAIWLEHDEFDRARAELSQYLDADRDVPTPWLRLIAANALERGARDRDAAALVRWAVTELASRDALDQVLDLAKRYGPDSLGDEGFALRYVRGVMTYSEARQRHGGDGPTVDEELVGQYEQAASDLEAALGEPDATNYADALPACRRLIAYCRYFEGRFVEAKDAFVAASAQLHKDDEAAEALWMAIVCLDKVAGPRNESRAAELDELMQRFLRQYPSSEYAPRIMLKQALAQRTATDESVATLLEIPENSEVYDAARRRAVHVLYQLFRGAGGDARLDYARRFVDVALPQTTAEMRRFGEDGAPSVDDLVARCRMLLEVSLTDGVARVAAARQAFAWLDTLGAEHGADLSPYRSELDYRRLLERQYADDIAAAAALADGLWNRDERSIWSRLASRAMFGEAHQRWRAAATNADVDVETLRRIDRYGGRILLETAGATGALEDPAVLAYHAAVAEADWVLWQREGDEQRGRAALTLYERLLRQRPSNAEFLRATAKLSQKLGKPEQALDCVRRLLAGTEVRSDVWFEAKFEQIQLLIDLGRLDKAREVLEQHKLLNPDYGPDPWGGRIKGLEQRLNDAPPKSVEAAPGTDGGEAGR